jgi:hypothetical protein
VFADTEPAVGAEGPVPVVRPGRAAVAVRFTNIPPMPERFGSSRLRRITEKLFPGRERTLSVCMFSAPTLNPLTLPLRRPPPRIGTISPRSSRPMRRLKNRSTSSPLPTRNSPSSRERTAAFSGKRRLNRVRLILLRVDLDLREVGVIGGIQVQAGRHAEFRVEPEVAVEIGRGGAR